GVQTCALPICEAGETTRSRQSAQGGRAVQEALPREHRLVEVDLFVPAHHVLLVVSRSSGSEVAGGCGAPIERAIAASASSARLTFSRMLRSAAGSRCAP